MPTDPKEGTMPTRKVKIKTHSYHGSDDWCAYDDNSYDGPGSVCGWGETEAEAIEAFKLAWDARYGEMPKAR